MENLHAWCQYKHLSLSTLPRRRRWWWITEEERTNHTPLCIKGWSSPHIQPAYSFSSKKKRKKRKAKQRLHRLRQLRKLKASPVILQNLLHLHSCCSQDHNTLLRVITLPTRQVLTGAQKISRDSSHPRNGLFTLLKSGRRFSSLKAWTESF